MLELAARLSAGAVVWAGGLEPDETDDDAALVEALRARGIAATLVPQANLLAEPLSVRTREGRPYTVFTPFWRARLAAGAPEAPLPAPAALPAAPADPAGLSLDELEREAVRPWAAEFATVWRPGETGAQARLERFLDGPLARVRRRPRPPGPGGELPALAAPPLGRADGSSGVARGRGDARRGGP